MILRHTLRSFSKLQRNLSTLPILLLHGPHLWPNVATLDGRVNLRDVLWNSAVMREHILESGKMTIDTSSNDVTSCNPQTAFQQVLESVIGGRIVQVIHQSLDGCSVWLGTTQLLNCQANVLVGAGATADMAGSAGCDKQTLATNHLEPLAPWSRWWSCPSRPPQVRMANGNEKPQFNLSYAECHR